MTKTTLLVLFTVLVLVSLPATVLGQQPPPIPNVFLGSVTVDGDIAADGTGIIAILDGQYAGFAAVRSGSYSMTVAPATHPTDNTVTFLIVGALSASTGTFADGSVETLPLHFHTRLSINEVFRPLIASGNLVSVHHFDSSAQKWTFFDPRPEVAQANDYTSVSSGDTVWVRVTSRTNFQDSTLYPGWNNIALK